MVDWILIFVAERAQVGFWPRAEWLSAAAANAMTLKFMVSIRELPMLGKVVLCEYDIQYLNLVDSSWLLYFTHS